VAFVSKLPGIGNFSNLVAYSFFWSSAKSSELPPLPAQSEPASTSTEIPPYVYKQLPNSRSIRLLKFRTTKEQRFYYALETVSLNKQPLYTALSCIWGDSRLEHVIDCEDGELKVTANLYRALQRLHDDEKEQLCVIFR
jgi:hypothetical protein